MSMSISLSCFEALMRVSAEIVAILAVWREGMGAIVRIVGSNGPVGMLDGSFSGAGNLQGLQTGSRRRLANC